MPEDKKRCPGCRCMKSIADFYGLRKSNTCKCIVCNTSTNRNTKKKNAEKAIAKKKEQEKKIIDTFIQKNQLAIPSDVIY